MSDPLLIWVSPPAAASVGWSMMGHEGARLMALAAAGLPVPPAFCLTTAAYRAFLTCNDVASASPPVDLQRALGDGQFPDDLEGAVTHARAELAARAGALAAASGGKQDVVRLAVRSSATVDGAQTVCFAGQALGVLGVQGDTEMLAAIRDCWASLGSEPAQGCRSSVANAAPEMAVIVQQIIPCDLSGTAASVDAVDGRPDVVVGATLGFGDQLFAGGTVAERCDGAPRSVPPGPGHLESAEGGLLRADQVEQIAGLVRSAEACLGVPQQVEWGFLGGHLFLLQSIPVPVRSTSFFSERIPGDQHLWTGAFLNERLPRPVSPLGWTLLRGLLAPLALSDPLRFLGVRLSAIPPLTKLYRGHPYVNVAVFQMLYAIFPDWLLPADACRYFPGGNISLRREVPYPRSLLHPRAFLSLVLAFVRQAAAASPWHNWRSWERFEGRCACALADLRQKLDGTFEPPDWRRLLWGLFQQGQSLNIQLLKLHRWSLTLAELTYTLLRRLLESWLPPGEPGSLAARLVSGLPSYSLELDAALYELASGRTGVREFLERFGHRGFDLDIAHRTFADDPALVMELASYVRKSGTAPPSWHEQAAKRRVLQVRVEQRLRRWQRLPFREVLRLAQAYMLLRENQRFVWQKILAYQRRVLLAMGNRWTTAGELDRPDAIFGATLAEVAAAAAGRAGLPSEAIAARNAELARLEAEHDLSPQSAYPAFLRGDRPLIVEDASAGPSFRGLPVSPGLGRGPARIVLSPEHFARVRAGDVLVTMSADPGWTPLFGLLAGLVLETGGELSHGAIIAREYGLPAVAAIPGITSHLADGQQVAVDGRTGSVTVEAG